MSSSSQTLSSAMMRSVLPVPSSSLSACLWSPGRHSKEQKTGSSKIISGGNTLVRIKVANAATSSAAPDVE